MERNLVRRKVHLKRRGFDAWRQVNIPLYILITLLAICYIVFKASTRTTVFNLLNKRTLKHFKQVVEVMIVGCAVDLVPSRQSLLVELTQGVLVRCVCVCVYVCVCVCSVCVCVCSVCVCVCVCVLCVCVCTLCVCVHAPQPQPIRGWFPQTFKLS